MLLSTRRLGIFRLSGKISRLHKNLLKIQQQNSKRLATQQVINTKLDEKWETARPYEDIPGPNTLRKVREFLPGGKFHNLNLLELNQGLTAEYGGIIRIKGYFRQSDFVLVSDPLDFEKVFRTEGIWPIRTGMESFVYFRKHIRPDVFKGVVGVVAEYVDFFYVIFLKTVLNYRRFFCLKDKVKNGVKCGLK